MPSYIRTRTEFAVNSFTTGNQTAPSVATFADGGFVMVWGTSDPTQDGDGSAIKAQLFDSAGNKVGIEFLVNTGWAGSQFTASVATLANGSFLVTWVSLDGDGNYGIKAQLFGRAGDPIGGEIHVNTTSGLGFFAPSVAQLADGGFVISWDESGGGFDAKAQIFDAGGGRVGGEFRLNTNAGATQDSAVITGLANGGFVATWRTTDPSADGFGDAVKAQIFSASGAKVGVEFLVNSQKIDSQYDPSITALAGGGFVITWATRDSAQDGSSGAVKGQIFSASGAKVGAEFLVNTQAADIQREAVVTATPDGGFVVAWTNYSASQDGSSFAVKAQAFDATGAKVGGEMLVNTLAAGAQFLPDIATLADGRLIVAWASESGDIGGYAVRAQILGTEPAPPQPNTRPIIISNGAGTSASLTVDEGTTAVTRVVASDDGEPNNLRYSITGGFNADLFTINALTGELAFINPPDHVDGADNFYTVTVTASDGELSSFQSIQVSVRHVNHVTIVSDGGYDWAQVFIDENQTAVTIVSALDDDGVPLTYALEAWEDAAFFTIDPQTGELSFTVAPDYEYPEDLDGDGVYIVYVTASDGNVSDMQRIDIVVGDVDEGVEGAVVITSDGGGDEAVVAVAENGTAVTLVAATGAGAVIYEIVGGDDAWQFVIDPQTGALEFMYPADFDAANDSDFDNVYDVVVRASDGLTFDDQHLSVVLQNVDEAPIIYSYWGTFGGTVSLTMAENGWQVGAVAAYDPDDWYAPITYSIAGGADAGLFTVDPDTGELTFVYQLRPDFEAPTDADGDNVYDVVVAATSGTLSATQTFAVTIENENEGVYISSNGGGTSAAIAMNEGESHVTTVVGYDPDGTVPTYAIVGGPDAARFAIDAVTGVLSFVDAPDYEAPADEAGDNFYTVEVAASDGYYTSWQTIQILIGNVNEGVTITTGPALSVDEDSGFVTRVTATDGDGDPISYAIVGGADASHFVIDPETGDLTIRASLDFEAPADDDGDNVYEVTVRATDGQLSDERQMSITVNDVYDDVEIVSYGGADSVSLTVQEGAFQVADVEASLSPFWGTRFAISGADAALFTINQYSGELSFNYPFLPDFEFPADADGDNVYDVVVTASTSTSSDSQAFAVTVVNRNEGLWITSNDGGDATVSMNEGDRNVTTVTAYDQDGDVPTYSIAGGPDAALFAIDPATGVLTFVDAPDYEAPADGAGDNFYTVEVAASDGYYTSWQTIQILIGNVNEGLDIVSYGAADIVYLDAAENGLAAAQLAAVDRDGDAPTYSITGGADAALFAVDAATGALSFVGAPDFENPADADGDNVYMVVVTASDGEFSDWQAFGVTIGNVQEKVTITSGGGGGSAAVTVGENGGDVTIVVAEDDDGTFPTFAIVGGADAARFTIDAQTGALRFVSAPDHEAPGDSDGDNVYDVVVRATDGSFFDDQAIAVSVANVDEGLAITSYGGAETVLLSRSENGPAVGQVAAVDQDDDPVTYLIVGGADSVLFTVDPVTGALSFAASPDFEAPADADGDNVYKVEVAAISGGFTDTQAFAVTISNVNEALAITSNGGGASAAVSVGENGRSVTIVAATDPDGTSATYSIVGGADAARFTIDPQTGVLQFVAAPDYEQPGDADGDNVYSVTVQAGDGQYLDSQALSVAVANLRDGATVTGTNGGDSISGTSTNPALRTTNAEDTVSGRDGHDTILGLGGDDILNGDAGNDTLTGGAGADRLTGGLGKDQFVYNAVSDSTPGARDVITDFSRSQSDKISLSAIDANSLVAGNQGFTFIGAAAFSGVAGQLRYATLDGVTLVSGDVNGDGLADFQIELSVPITPVASDFVL